MVKWSDQLVSQHFGSVNHHGPDAARPSTKQAPATLVLVEPPSFGRVGGRVAEALAEVRNR